MYSIVKYYSDITTVLIFSVDKIIRLEIQLGSSCTNITFQYCFYRNLYEICHSLRYDRKCKNNLIYNKLSCIIIFIVFTRVDERIPGTSSE